MGFTRHNILTAQFECYQKIMKDTNHNRTDGSMCKRTWDGWMCWDDLEAGVTSAQHCPDYYNDFDTSEMAIKICTDSGHWFVHPESNRTWTNYTGCNHMSNDHKRTAFNLYYLALIGHGLSLISLFTSLGIFFYFKSLSCQRITLHKNLFFSFVLNSVITIIFFTCVANNQEVTQANPVTVISPPLVILISCNWFFSQVSCKVSVFIHHYLLGCNYFWMLCEGIYLHTLIVVAVFAEKQHLMWYYLLGWGFPLIPAFIHAISRSYYYNDNCWISSNTSLLYIIHGPICAALLINLFFLLNIVRVLITKLKVTHQAESSLYMRAVRATLILVPLLGIQYLLLPYKPDGRLASEIFMHTMNILMHYQGLLVATIFCFFNSEVSNFCLKISMHSLNAFLTCSSKHLIFVIMLNICLHFDCLGARCITKTLEPVPHPVWQHICEHRCPAFCILHGLLHDGGPSMLQHRQPHGVFKRQELSQSGDHHSPIRQPVHVRDS
uniref:Calcitonin gene-related peptide type 1 receptor n=1 Tax=Sinocyclocheilus grahami TaxID=75366 RepID=A0A672NN58_SINGR